MHLKCYIWTFVLCLSSTFAFSQSDVDTSALRKWIKSTDYTSFIRHDLNAVEYDNPLSVAAFFDQLSRTNQRKLTILHIGDSHVQADIGANYTRNYLQLIFGYGGRGSIFPYAAANTHSAQDYSTTCTGKWKSANDLASPPKFSLGISGVTIRSTDSTASFAFTFNSERAQLKPHYTRLDLFCATGDSCFAMEYAVDGGSWRRIQASEQVSSIQYTCALNIAPIYELKFRCVKSDSLQRCVEIYGVSLSSAKDEGILYHSVGINGARINAVHKMNYLSEQLKTIRPDLVWFDLCANDMAFGDFDSLTVRHDLDKALDIIREAQPGVCIVLSDMQDIYIKGRNVVNAQRYSNFIRNYAKEKGVAFYDYYRVAGGRYSMKKWNENGLCAKDMCHLSKEGYSLKGQLCANAILQSYLQYLQFPQRSLLLKDTVQARVIEEKTTIVVETKDKTDHPEKNNKPQKKKSGGHKVHVVKKGESLYSIAKKYNTTVAKLKSLNKLKSDTIKQGQKLYVS